MVVNHLYVGGEIAGRRGQHGAAKKWKKIAVEGIDPLSVILLEWAMCFLAAEESCSSMENERSKTQVRDS